MSRHLVATAAVVAALAACSGGSGGGDDVATLTGADGARVTTSTTMDPEEAMLAFAECMRDQGVDFPDPSADGRLEISVGAAEADAWQAAEEACEEFRPAMQPPTAEEIAEIEERERAVNECMREHGYDLPEPEIRTPGDGGVQVRQQAPEGLGFDPEDPEFQAAMRECRDAVGADDIGGMRTSDG